jgi:signal transduction histidine kinase
VTKGLQIKERKLLINLRESVFNPYFPVLLMVTIFLFVFYSYWPWVKWPDFFPDFALFELRYRIVGSLFLIPFFYATFFFSWQGGLLVWFGCLISLIIRMYQLNLLETLSRNLLFWLLPPSLLLISTLETKWRKNLVRRDSERRTYISQILQAQEEERRHISQELHDGTIQTLLVVANRAETLASFGCNEGATEIRKCAEWLRDTVLEATTELRGLIVHLRPSVLDSSGLIPALMWLVDGLNKSKECEASLNVVGTERKLKPMMEVTIFRIVQEAISNVRQHSRAKKAWVTIKFQQKFIEIHIVDDGCGFSFHDVLADYAIENKFGLIGMRERTDLLGGKFEIDSKPGGGTKISATLKLR